MFDAIGDFFSGIWDDFLDWGSSLIDSITDAILTALSNFVGMILYYIDIAVCKILQIIYSMFSVFAGISKVKYVVNNEESYDFLINIFFSNSAINNVYWGMALIGIAMAFAFAIAAVIRKVFDLYDKQQRSIGQILTSLGKSVLMILLMNVIVLATINCTNVLLQRITYLFDNAEYMDKEDYIEFTSEDYVIMNRVLQTVGNYSMNPSYDSRYNINSCFNAIRKDLLSLQNKGVFDFYYYTADKYGNEIVTWQSEIQKVVNSASLKRDLMMDVYYETVQNAIIHLMDTIRNNPGFTPLDYFERQYKATEGVGLDVLIFLSGTTSAAKNSDFNINPSMTDGARGAYYTGVKSIYSFSNIKADFNYGIGGMDHLIIILLGILMFVELLNCVMTCIARIFQLLMLFIISPPVIAVIPLDDGAKFKQWITAFLVQSLGFLGTVIAMRILLLFIPIITSSNLVLFDNCLLNLLGKTLLIYGGVIAAQRSDGIITGILADSAGFQSISAGNMRGQAMGLATGFGKAVKATAGTGAKIAGGAVNAAATVTGVKTVANKIGSGIKGLVSGAADSMSNNYGILGALGSKIFGGKSSSGVGGGVGGPAPAQASMAGSSSSKQESKPENNTSSQENTNNNPSPATTQTNNTPTDTSQTNNTPNTSNTSQNSNNTTQNSNNNPNTAKTLPKMTPKQFDNLFGAGEYAKKYGNNTQPKNLNANSTTQPKMTPKQFDNLFGKGEYDKYYGKKK